MRRPHRKTRTGCLQCRQRRIKCGEEKPACAHCVRYELPCRFEEPKRRAAPRARMTPPSLENALVQRLNAPSAQLHTSQQAAFSIEDLELLHFYTTNTFHTFSANRDELWQLHVPAAAAANPFLMYGLLTTAALHMATLAPHRRQRLRMLAAAHEERALPEFRAAITRVDASNGTAIFAFAAFIVACTAAASTLAAANDPRSASNDDAVELPPSWLLVLRGSFSLLSAHAKLRAIGAIMPSDAPPTDYGASPDDVRLIALLPLLEPTQVSERNPWGSSTTAASSASGLPALPPLPRKRPPLSTEDASEVRSALNALRSAMALPYNTPLSSSTASFMWPGMVTSDFMTLVSRHAPEALVVLAHYCVLLHRSEGGRAAWYQRGQARLILQRVGRTLRAQSEDWIAWIEWPITCVFGAGEYNSRLVYRGVGNQLTNPWRAAFGLSETSDEVATSA